MAGPQWWRALCHGTCGTCLNPGLYVRCMMIDFAKAFDTVDHAIVLRKMNALNMPASIKNWIINFLILDPKIFPETN